MFSFLKTHTKLEYRKKVMKLIQHTLFLTPQLIELEQFIQIHFTTFRIKQA
jgi:hypothetical protein